MERDEANSRPVLHLCDFLPRLNHSEVDIFDPVQFRRLVDQDARDRRERDLLQVRALLAAGWKYELPEGHDDLEPMSWYWRAPPKRAGSRGRRYLSTNQAYNAMQRSK